MHNSYEVPVLLPFLAAKKAELDEKSNSDEGEISTVENSEN